MEAEADGRLGLPNSLAWGVVVEAGAGCEVDAANGEALEGVSAETVPLDNVRAEKLSEIPFLG